MRDDQFTFAVSLTSFASCAGDLPALNFGQNYGFFVFFCGQFDFYFASVRNSEFSSDFFGDGYSAVLCDAYYGDLPIHEV